MTNIDLYPIEDNYESKLSQPYNGTDSVIYVDSVPASTFPSGQKVIFTINPGTSFAQAVEVSGWSTGQLTVSSTTVEKGNGINYSTTTHGAKSPIIISDNFVNWKEIATVVNTKADIATPTFTGYVGIPTYADNTARDAAIPSPTGKELIKVAGDVQQYNSVTAQWEVLDTGTTTPNMSTSVTGKGRLADQTQVNDGTATESGDPLVVGPAELKTVTDGISVEILSKMVGFGNGSDGDVTISGTVTLSRDMHYNNLTIPTGQILNPNGYRIFVRGTLSGAGKIQRNGNNGGNASLGTPGAAATTLNQGSLNAEVASGIGGNAPVGFGAGGVGGAGTSANPSYANVNGANGGAGGVGAASSGGVGGTGGTSTRGSLYNIAYNPLRALYDLCGPGSFASSTSQYKGISSPGGGGGSGAIAGSGGGVAGGGGGGNGGFIRVMANIINWTGVFESIGGNGGNGANAVSNGGAGGGGAGGNGGVVVGVYGTKTSAGSTTLTGGTGGTAGTGGYSSPFAANGSNGNSGQYIEILV